MNESISALVTAVINISKSTQSPLSLACLCWLRSDEN